MNKVEIEIKRHKIKLNTEMKNLPVKVCEEICNKILKDSKRISIRYALMSSWVKNTIILILAVFCVFLALH